MIRLQKKIYKAAVIGTGRIGMKLESDPKRLKPATHFGMWNCCPDTELVAVCDSLDENLIQAQKIKPDLQIYNSAEQLLKEQRPEIVSIATWRYTHYEMMKLCSAYNVAAVICEKPIAENREHSWEIVEEFKKKGIHLFVNHRRRFDEILYPFVKQLKSGELIGEILQVNGHYVYGLLTTATHLVDTLRFFLTGIAGEIKWVMGFEHKFESFSPPDDPCEDFVLCFENGLKAFVQSLNMKDYDIYDAHLYGRKGQASLKNVGRDIELYNVIESSEHNGFTELRNTPHTTLGNGRPRDQFGFLAKNVVECLRGNASSLSTGEDSALALEILLAVRESTANNSAMVFI